MSRSSLTFTYLDILSNYLITVGLHIKHHLYPGIHKMYICLHFSSLSLFFFLNNLLKIKTKFINPVSKISQCFFIETRIRKSLLLSTLLWIHHLPFFPSADTQELIHFPHMGNSFPPCRVCSCWNSWSLHLLMSYGSHHLSSETFPGQPNREPPLQLPFCFLRSSYYLQLLYIFISLLSVFSTLNNNLIGLLWRIN